MAIMRKLCWLILLCVPAGAQTTIFSCLSGFNNTAGTACSSLNSYNASPGNYQFSGNWGPLTGSAGTLVPVGQMHNGNVGFYYNYGGSRTVNVQAFTTTIIFTPNGYNMALVLENNTVNDAYPAGAGAEGGFYQGAPEPPNVAPNKLFALEFDSYSSLQNSPNTFSYSSVQWYQQLQQPGMPNAGGCTTVCPTDGLSNYPINKVSTSPVPMNGSGGAGACYPNGTGGTCDTFEAMIAYDGWNLNLCLYDVTAANGSCSSATSGTGTYFTTSWSGVLIPEIVGATTARPSISAGVGTTATQAILVNGWSYTVQTPTGTPSYTAWNAGSTYNTGTVSSASPVYSVAPGTYGSAQSVSITTSTTPNNYICYTLSSTVPTIFPYPDHNGGCSAGNLYTGAISISSTATLYAVAGSNNSAFTGTSYSGLGPPSTLVAGTYTISGGTAATPTFSPAAGSYGPSQSVSISTTSSGAIICYTTNGTTPATNGSTGCTTGTLYSGAVSVASSETVKAIAGGTGFTDSSMGSAAYTINGAAATPTFSPAAGTYTGSQSVTASTSTSACSSYIYFDTNTTPTTNQSTMSVPSSETVYAYVHGCPGYSDSSIASAAYTINAFSPIAGQGGNIGGNVPIQ